MTPDDFALLHCVDCRGALTPEEPMTSSTVVLNALLHCESCGRYYPIVDQVALMFRKHVVADYLEPFERARLSELGYDACVIQENTKKDEGHKRQLAVSKNWEYQWREVIEVDSSLHNTDPYFSEELQWNFIPIDHCKVQNALVLLTCAGSGRELRNFAKLGPQKIIVNEIGSEIHQLTDMLPAEREKLVFIRSDATFLPVQSSTVDIAVCDHGLQHILDHRAAFDELARVTKRHGRVSICVYSHENNWVMTRIVEPMKPLLHRLPLKAQRLVALLPTVTIFTLIHLLYRPLRAIFPTAAMKLPLASLLDFWAPRPFEGIWCSCFDLMHAPISYHFRQKNLITMAEDNGMRVDKLVHTYKALWSLVATKN